MRDSYLVVFLENALRASCTKLKLLYLQGAIGLLLGRIVGLLRDASAKLTCVL